MQKNEKRKSSADARYSKTNSSSLPVQPSNWKPGIFDHQRLDVFNVAREALARGDKLARALPRGYGKLRDQLRRALLSAYLGIAEAASRTGDDRRARFRCARGETTEAAAALEAVALLRLAPTTEVEQIICLLARMAAMLTRLAR